MEDALRRAVAEFNFDLASLKSHFTWTALLVGLIYMLSLSRREKSLPPGPPTLPLIGNLHLASRGDVHVQLAKWAQQYGDIFSLKTGPSSSSTTIVLTGRVVVKELLDRRGANYADRPDSYVLEQLVTGSNHVLPMRYGERWRRLRRVLRSELSEARCDAKHLPLQHAEAIQLLADLVREPGEYRLHPKRFSTSIMTSTVCGIRLINAKGKFMTELHQMFHELVSTTVTGASPPVDQVPLFKYLPEIMWNNWKSKASNVSKKLKAFYGGLVERVKQRRERGPSTTSAGTGVEGDVDASSISFIDHVLDRQNEYGVTDEELLFLCGTLLEGGSDTSSMTILNFIDAMLQFPVVQQRAHAHIDTALDASRSPSWDEDYARLPYVAQLVKETIRWRTLSPTAFPHATTRPDVYRGFSIPARATILLNVYGLHRDPNYFPDPDDFRPERFDGLTAPADRLANAADPDDPVTGRDHYGYGAGRRICPGIHLAERNLFIAIAKLLWAFEFQLMDDKDETTGLPQGPAGKGRCRIKVRSEERRRTIFRELEIANTDVFSKYEVGD